MCGTENHKTSRGNKKKGEVASDFVVCRQLQGAEVL
jgi:hypothetical protein